MSLDYLWNNIRIKLGAYGCGCNIQKSNRIIYMYSYRDPNLKASYECYDKASSYISKFEASEREITKYIIGTINNFDKPLTNSEKVYKAIHRFIANITPENLQKERDEILSTTSPKIKEYTQLLNKLVENGSIYTIGSESAINKYSDMFGSIARL
ncbi:hypothetical protein SDC9_194172 [bioreactor metagenome]|uniref:Presequence protease mitochondrial-type C-terminal domain-containing protein n=1 Tax=bioreactor metagenome TaxID=1076179 RepID=A0A645I5K1_9ZZZZ